MIYRPSDCLGILKHRDRMFSHDVHVSRPLMLHMISGGEQGHRIERERGGMDLLDFEVYTKDYLDKFMHANLAAFPDPDKISHQSVGVRLLSGIVRDTAYYEKIEASIDKYLSHLFKVDCRSSNIMVSQLDLCQEQLPCCSCLRAREDTEHSLICSEFVAEVYKNAGLVDSRLNPSEFVPAMFDTTRDLLLSGGAKLSHEHVLHGPKVLADRRAMGYPVLPPSVASNQKRYPVNSMEFGPGGFAQVNVGKAVESADMSISNAPAQNSMHAPLSALGPAVVMAGFDEPHVMHSGTERAHANLEAQAIVGPHLLPGMLE